MKLQWLWLQTQKLVAATEIDAKVLEYAVKIVRRTREYNAIYRGAGSRACLALVRLAKAKAFLENRQFVIPDDVKALAVETLQHRVILTPDAEIDGSSKSEILRQLLQDIDAPRL